MNKLMKKKYFDMLLALYKKFGKKPFLISDFTSNLINKHYMRGLETRDYLERVPGYIKKGRNAAQRWRITNNGIRCLKLSIERFEYDEDIDLPIVIYNNMTTFP